MRLSPPSLLIVVVRAVVRAAVLSTVAACTLNSGGLGASDAGHVAVGMPDAAKAAPDAGGAAGMDITGVAGEMAPSGAAGVGPIAGADGAAAAGGSAGGGAVGAAGDGIAGDGAAGADGSAGVVGAVDAGGDLADAHAVSDASDAADATSPPEVHPISPIGCADGTREGLTSLTKFPNVTACAGGWQVPGLLATNTLSPQCDRAAGNDGAKPTGEGCSVADLCAEGWHVCESAHEFSTKNGDCNEAFPGGGVKMFFVTRQRGPMTTCDPNNLMGTNNVYGCGNFGSNAMAACAPFMRMLRDADCNANPPWMCVDGPINTNLNELLDITKPGASHGGVLCCR